MGINQEDMLKNHGTTSHTSTTLIYTLFLLLINFHDSSFPFAAAAGGSSVKFLPGFDGPLPFELETGYIGVGESQQVQLFYYFTKSENNPTEDPLLLWFNGGPGCSALTGLLFEIGPIKFDDGVNIVHYNFPKLVLNPYSWTQIASIIFIDLPVGTGFSYATNPNAALSDPLQTSDHAHDFIRKWLIDHPQFISNQVYIAGDSVAGLMVPIITQLISDGNDLGMEPKIDLKGYVLGNPKTTPNDDNYRIPFAHGMGLISDELYESLKEACSGNYYDIDPTNALCLQNMNTFKELVNDLNEQQILEPNCRLESPRKLLSEAMYQSDLINLEIRLKEEGSPIKCIYELHRYSNYWANDKKVQKAIHIRKGTIGNWKQCNRDLPFNLSITDAVPYHANLGSKGYRSLIYSGDHDLMIPFVGTKAWIRSLNLSIVDDWRPWIVEGQVAGYTRTYANRMTFTTIKGGGHAAPEFKPRECRAMFERWTSYRPL